MSRTAEVALGATFSLTAVAISVAAGPVAALRVRSPRAALRAGTFAGLISGVIVFVFGVVMTLSTLDILGARADYRAQMVRDHALAMPAFLVSDIRAATCAHLVINAGLGLVGAGLGGLVARSLRPPASVPST